MDLTIHFLVLILDRTTQFFRLEMIMKLKDKIALVTGSTSGIGAATARALAGEGARVIVAGRDEERGRSVVESIRAEGGTADFIAVALRDESSARSLASGALEIAGRVDILVNNAAIATFGPTASTTEKEFDDMYSVNVKVPFFLVAALAPVMAERGEGVIVNVSTMVGGFGRAGAALYGSSKAAISLLTKAWAAEFGPSGIRVNAVSPGPTRTEGTEFMGEALDQQAAAAPAGRVASPQEIASTILFMTTDGASFVEGAVLPVDGGRAAV
jgi:NAD(P)-dependent dehydrogenase (short-subunit alcohol dehydrogenase family)